MRKTTPPHDRPPVAIGHLSFPTNKVREATEFLIKLGLRSIFASENFAVLELRDGTHVIVKRIEEGIAPGTTAPFDLMVDDVEIARNQCSGAGMEPSAIEQGNIHHWFTIIDPSGYEITITSSHTGRRAV